MEYLKFDLQLFADGGAGAAGGDGGAAAGAGDAAGVTAPDAGVNRAKKRRENPLASVKYGKQPEPSAPSPDATGAAEAANTTGDAGDTGKKPSFQELIEGEYKDQYTEAFQSAFNSRFKAMKGMETALEAQKPIIDMLMQRHGIADGDISKLAKAIEQDDGYWEAAADEAGLTVEQYKAMQKLERENAELKKIRQRQQGQEMAQQKLNQWYAEAEQVKQTYPAFDFRAETQNRDFMGLLRSGLNVQQAYELVHMDEIKEAAARTAAETTGRQMTANIKAKASRPRENGTSTQSAAPIRKDKASELTRAERAEIVRRAARGDRIEF